MSNVAAQRDYVAETNPTAKKKTEVRIIKGIAASAGVAIGPCRVILRAKDLDTVKKGEILVFRTASPDMTLYMGRLKGLVTEVGGGLTVAANYAREYGVPYVAGVADVMAAVTDGQIIRLDGSKGTVSLL
jgi:pyruvate, water dikinase